MSMNKHRDRESPLQLQRAPAHCQLSCLSHDQDLFAAMHLHMEPLEQELGPSTKGLRHTTIRGVH